MALLGRKSGTFRVQKSNFWKMIVQHLSFCIFIQVEIVRIFYVFQVLIFLETIDIDARNDNKDGDNRQQHEEYL